jgi:hypothetical protein
LKFIRPPTDSRQSSPFAAFFRLHFTPAVASVFAALQRDKTLWRGKLAQQVAVKSKSRPVCRGGFDLKVGKLNPEGRLFH